MSVADASQALTDIDTAVVPDESQAVIHIDTAVVAHSQRVSSDTREAPQRSSSRRRSSRRRSRRSRRRSRSGSRSGSLSGKRSVPRRHKSSSSGSNQFSGRERNSGKQTRRSRTPCCEVARTPDRDEKSRSGTVSGQSRTTRISPCARVKEREAREARRLGLVPRHEYEAAKRLKQAAQLAKASDAPVQSSSASDQRES